MRAKIRIIGKFQPRAQTTGNGTASPPLPTQNAMACRQTNLHKPFCCSCVFVILCKNHFHNGMQASYQDIILLQSCYSSGTLPILSCCLSAALLLLSSYSTAALLPLSCYTCYSLGTLILCPPYLLITHMLLSCLHCVNIRKISWHLPAMVLLWSCYPLARSCYSPVTLLLISCY